ncbi:hypothetical protein CKQ84_19040 [Shewanella sp. WE21]|jgi:hypothetical protein|uniref:hypothetical protein n=1 Tax=Shewanella sp. WE21 TaxID=2029986 RepID=UPI000CF6C06A|nr:hypothetical protein [Shewanella sp. WE21]AVI67770.1 hypothetical protein CKQ84_19040 [Shewanella sp. WE21]
MLDIQAKSTTSAFSAPESEAKALELTLSQYPIAANIFKSPDTGTYSDRLFSGGLFSKNSRDPLSLIDQLLTKYITEQTKLAEAKANDISLKAEAIAEINRLWGLVMSELLPNTKPGQDVWTSLDIENIDKIDKIIKETLGNPNGVKEIIGDSRNATYERLQSMNATMTAYCDSIQVDLDTEQQKFKNIMTEVTSAQEEIRDVRRTITSMSQVR